MYPYICTRLQASKPITNKPVKHFLFLEGTSQTLNNTMLPTFVGHL